MRYLLDTDTVSLIERGDSTVLRRILMEDPADIFVSVITLHEQMNGRFKMIDKARTPESLALAYQQFAHTFTLLRGLPILGFGEPAILRFEELLKMKLNVGKNDLRIAAIALENAVTIVTRNRRDFERVPDLIIEDWSVAP